MLGFLLASWCWSQSWHSKSSGLDRLGVGSCFQCQSGHLEIADSFRMALSPAGRLLRGGGVGHVCTCPVGLIGDASANWPRGREIIISLCTQREVFAKFACELGWTEERTQLAALPASRWSRRLGGPRRLMGTTSYFPCLGLWRLSAGMYGPRLGATTTYLFLTSGRLGQTIKVAVLRWLRRSWAATWRGWRTSSSQTTAPCLFSVQVCKRLSCQMFSNTGLLASRWSWRSCEPRENQADVTAYRHVVVDGGTRVDRGFWFCFRSYEWILGCPADSDAERQGFSCLQLEKWNNQLRLMKGCYSGQENVVSELLKVGAPDEISSLFTFKTVGIPHHPRVSSWPLHALLEARALGVTVA